MSAQLLASKIIIQEDQPSARNVQGIQTGVLACLGITEKGPVGVATQLISYEQFSQIFGNDIGVGYAAGAMKAFFEGGGQLAYFTRVVHRVTSGGVTTNASRAGSLTLLSSSGSPAAAQITGNVVGPFALNDGDTIVLDHDAAGQTTVTFEADAAAITTSTGPFALQNGQTVVLRIDGGPQRTVTFDASQFVNIAAATAAEVAAAIGGALTDATVTASGNAVTITSKLKGNDSSLEVVSGTASSVLGLSTGVVSGGGNVDDISAVPLSEIVALINESVTGVTASDFGGVLRITGTTTGSSGKIQVMPGSTAADELGLDNLVHPGSTGAAQPTLRVDAKYDGAYSNNVRVMISAATSAIPSEFNLSVLVNGVLVESYPNLTMFNGATRHAEKIINADDAVGSKYIKVTDLRIAPGEANALTERPANSAGTPAVAFGPLNGGNDGLVGISEADFVGDSAQRNGFYSFDLIGDIELLICPEVASPAVHNAALSYCSVTRNGEVFFIADPPEGLTPEGIVNYVTTTAALKNTTEHGAIYWPRVKVLNPNTSIYGLAPTIVVPPSAHVAAMFARTDGSRVGGVYLPPGGPLRGQLPNVLGFENDAVLDEKVRDYITPALINPITRLRGAPIAVDDVLTLRSTGAFPTIAERRGVTYIERSLKDGIQYARLENNDATLRASLRRTIEAFLLGEMKRGAFRTQDPDTAFFVDVSDALNPPSEQFAGRVNIRVGLATQKPARWIIMTFAQDTRALDAELAAAG